jgi:sterol 14-demethylase
MMGRTMTVALGPKGNNLSLGGKVSQVSAEDAYTVCHLISNAESDG